MKWMRNISRSQKGQARNAISVGSWWIKPVCSSSAEMVMARIYSFAANAAIPVIVRINLALSLDRRGLSTSPRIVHSAYPAMNSQLPYIRILKLLHVFLANLRNLYPLRNINMLNRMKRIRGVAKWKAR
jgi:hypothetical protein